MGNFWHTVDTIPDGFGFKLFDGSHFGWLAAFVAVAVVNCLLYRRMDKTGRERWRKAVALLLVADELFKMIPLMAMGLYEATYLPLHLCSINIFVIAYHAWKGGEMVGKYLYTVCIPGAIAALLFCTWTELPLLNFMSIHSFTVHILLALYPIVLTNAGDIHPEAKSLPKCLMILAGLGAVALAANLLLDTNFMFLMYAEEGNPLYIFQQLWGSHLLGFPVLITAVLVVMYVPMGIFRKLKKEKVTQ